MNTPAQMPLPSINHDMPDDAVLALWRRAPGLGEQLMMEAQQMHRQVLASPMAARSEMQVAWQRWLAGFNAYQRPDNVNANSAEDHAIQVRRIRHAAAVREVYKRYLGMTAEELAGQSHAMRQATVMAMQAATTGMASAPSQAHAFDVGVAVRQLAKRGVTLSLGSDGSLLAAPAGLLSAADRQTLVANEAPLKAFLAQTEKVA